MSEKVSPTQSDLGAHDNVSAVLDALGGWGPKDRHWTFQRWHRGALSLVNLSLLAALEAEGPLSMSRLAEALDVSVASATGIVDRMERRGLVDRHHDTEDRRVVLVALTPAGLDVFREIAARRREHLAALLSELSEGDLAAFLRGIRALSAARATIVERHRLDGTLEGAIDGSGVGGDPDMPDPSNGSYERAGAPAEAT